jgi:hypothetical protein
VIISNHNNPTLKLSGCLSIYGYSCAELKEQRLNKWAIFYLLICGTSEFLPISF